MDVLVMNDQPKNRSFPPFIGVALQKEQKGDMVLMIPRAGTVPLYTASDIHQFFELTIGCNSTILRSSDGNRYTSLHAFYEDEENKTLLEET